MIPFSLCALEHEVMTKAEYEHAKMLTMAIAADAMADDDSAHTVDIMTEVDQQLSGPIEQKRSRHKPADLEGEKSKASQVPRTIRRDSTLTIPSPSARDAEVMASNQVGLNFETLPIWIWMLL